MKSSMTYRKPQLVLVTGAAGALGIEVAKRFAEAGCQVVGTYIDALPTLEIPRVEWAPLDATSETSVERLFGETKNGFDAVVHCIGGFRYGPLETMPWSDVDFLLSTNLTSSLRVARHALTGMREREFGRLVFVSAKATLAPPKGMAVYAATKAALNALTVGLAEEVKPLDITVNAVLPTIIDTPANRRDMPSADWRAWVPATDLGQIIFDLTQPSHRAINGALIPVSGRL